MSDHERMHLRAVAGALSECGWRALVALTDHELRARVVMLVHEEYDTHARILLGFARDLFGYTFSNPTQGVN